MRHDSSAPFIRVLVSDDTRVHTELLADVLKRDSQLHVSSSSSGSSGLTTRPSFHDVDVLLMSSVQDEKPGRGFEILRGLRTFHPEMRCVILLDSCGAEAILESFRSGARGVFSKNESVETLGKCLRRVYEGQIWANSQQLSMLVKALASSHNLRAVNAEGLDLLSKREMEVVNGVAHGLSNREIAEQLKLSQHTVKNCLFRVFDKLGVSNRIELLFMTVYHERFASAALQPLLDGNVVESLRDKSALIACERAAEQGVLWAQLALAQFYAAQTTNGNALHAHTWYSMASEQISRAYTEVTRLLTVDQLIQSEQMIAARRGQQVNLSPQVKAGGPVKLEIDKHKSRRPSVGPTKPFDGRSVEWA